MFRTYTNPNARWKDSQALMKIRPSPNSSYWILNIIILNQIENIFLFG